MDFSPQRGETTITIVVVISLFERLRDVAFSIRAYTQGAVIDCQVKILKLVKTLKIKAPDDNYGYEPRRKSPVNTHARFGLLSPFGVTSLLYWLIQ